MKDTRRATKIYLKHLPVPLVKRLIEEYEIPTPEKQVLLSACVERKGGFAGVEYLRKTYGINISYWQFVSYLARGLDRFYTTHLYKGKDYTGYLQ